MKKTIGIVTIGDYNNYGNRLQNFALYYVLNDKLQNNAYTIVNFKNFETQPQKFSNHVLWYLKRMIKGMLKVGFLYFKMEKKIQSRRSNLKAFSEKWTKEYTPKNAKFRIDVDYNDFDKIVLGSDQVWNFEWVNKDQANYYMLSGVPREKRIGYAVSMGNPPVKRGYLINFKREIRYFDCLSVREKATQKYLKNKFNIDSELVLDPTMLLSKKEWVTALNLKKADDSPFVLTYFLSEPSNKMKSLLQELRKTEKLKVINLFSTNKGDIKYYDVDPKEMLEYIFSASCILTDSFHGSVFSSLFHVPFVVDNNRDGGGMSSRITTLLDTLKLQNRVLTTDYSIRTLFSVTFSHVDKILLDEQKKSLLFLDNAINMDK